MEDIGEHLDIFGQSAGLYKLYTQLSLCFRMEDASSEQDVINTLTRGLEQLSTSFPWVAGQVVHEKAEDHPDTYRIKPFKTPRLVIKHSGHETPLLSMESLRQASFPFAMLDESTIASINTFAGGTDDPAPILELQATFISGGFILTFATQHNVMDMTGMVQAMKLLSKACHHGEFTAEELRIGNLDRRNLIALLDESYVPGPELENQIVKPASLDASKAANEEAAPVDPPPCKWVYFLFSAASLATLKSNAMKCLTDPSSYVSTDDTLSAFIWQGVSRARLPRLTSHETTTFARAIDPRRYVDIPATYPGLVQNMAYSSNTIESLVNAPLGTVSSELRKAVDPKTSNLGYATRALATWSHRVQDKNSINVTATLDLSRDIMLSSWTKYDCYDLDFHLGLGRPEAVRRPQFTPVESLFYLMPKRTDGEVAVALCLRKEDLERLRGDAEFMKHAQYVG